MNQKNKSISDKKFEENKETITQDIDNTLQRVVNDYSNHWKGVLGESIQNSYDAWVTNRFERGVIPESDELTIELEININKREYRWSDNAGGMPSNIFYERFAGLDTPGDAKVGGGAGGAYGRGFHVIAGAGEETYAETRHAGFHGGLVVRGAHQARYDQLNDLNRQGTDVTVKNCDVDLLVKLADRERTHQHIQARFQKMLEHDNVTVKVTIDGRTEEVKPVDLSEFEVLWEGEIDFELGDDTKTLTDCVVYRKQGENIPFDGMSMCKRHNKMSEPYMRVKQYRPREVRHLDKMFGFCDASILCPEYENNAHTGWVGSVLPANIKQRFEEIEREEFIGGPADLEQRDEIVDAALETLTEQWDDNPFEVTADNDDLDFGVESKEDGGTDDLQDGDNDLGGPDDQDIDVEDIERGGSLEDDDDVYVDSEEGDDESETERTDELEEDGDPSPVLRCQTRRRTFDAGETVDIRVFVDNPEETGEQDYEVEAEVESDSGGITSLEPRTITVQEGETSGGAHGWQFDPDNQEGKFVFRGELHSNGSSDVEGDSTNTYFYVGDTIDNETGQAKSTFIEDIELYPDPEDDKFRHRLVEGEKALLLLANKSHPEYRYAEKLDGRNSTENQIALLVRWGQEAVMNYLLLDRFEPELRNIPTEDGEPLDEQMAEFVGEQIMDNLSAFSAETYRSLI